MEVAAGGYVTKALSVLLIDDNPARAEIVESGLRAAGYRLLARLEGTQDLTTRVRELERRRQPDVGDRRLGPADEGAQLRGQA